MNLGCGIFNINNDESVDTLYENIEDTLTEAVGEMYDGISLKPNALDIFEKKLKHLIEEAYFKPDPQHKTEDILVEAVAEALSELAPSHKRLPDNIFNMYCLGDASGQNILNLIQKSRNTQETTNESSKHDELDKTAQEKYEEETDKMPFLTAGYRTSLGAQHRMETTMFHGLMRSFFVGDESQIQTFADVNEEIRKFYEEQYNLILDFIKYKKPDADFTDIEHLYKIEHGKPVYTGAFEIIQERFSDILKAIRPRLSIDESSGYPTVRDLDNWEDNYAKAKSDLQERCKKSLDAYNAMFILTHHDDLVHKFFSKVDIAKGMPNKWNSFDLVGIIGHKYQFGTMSNSLTTWHDDDKDFSAADLMDDETKGIVNTTKYKLYGENVQSMGKYITLADFNRIVTKLKKIAYLDSGTTPITGALAETIKSIYGKSYPNLRTLIGELNSDAPVNFKNLFTLLSKDSFWQAYPKFQDLDLEAEDKNLIWSIYKGLFEDEPSNWKPGDDLSLFAKWMRDPDLNNSKNYYDNIAQACSSIEALTLQQFKRDSDGLITNQTLRDNVNSGISSRIERAITGALDPNSLNDFIGRFKQFTPKELKEGQIDNYWKNFGFKNVAFYKDLTLQVGNFTIVMNSNSDTVHIYKNGQSYMGKQNVDGTASKNLTFSKEDLMELLPFIQRVLPTFKIENIDSPLIEVLRRRESSSGQAYDTATRKLIKLAAGVYKLAAVEQYIKSKYNRQGSISELDYRNSLSDFFDKDHMPRIDQTIANGALSSLISKGNLITFKDIATAQQIVEGVYGDNTTRDSEGKLISQIGMSMLVTKIEQQVYTQNLKPNSATKHFALWEGGFYKGAQFTREFAGVEDSTVATKFNVNEHFQAQFVYDYIHGILPKEDAYDHRYVGMMPSVLSDKSRILKILTDFHTDNTFGFKDAEGHTLKWKDLNAKQWEQIANIELGTYYYNIWNNTVDVFNKLNAFAKTDASPYKGVVFDPYNNFQSFNLWCQTTGNNAGEVLRVMAREYNKINPKDIVEITDQIHYVNTVDKNNNPIITVNRGIISMLSRFSNNGQLTLSTKGVDRSAILTDFANYVNRIRGEEFIKQAVNTRTGEKYELGRGNIVTGYNTKFVEKSSEEFKKDLASYIANTHKYIPIEAFIKTTDSGLQVQEAENINVDLGSFLNINSFGFTPVTNEQFWQQKKSMLVRNLLNNGATISTINPTTSEPLDQPELKLLKGENNEWLHESGDIAFARVKVRNENGEEYWIKLASLANASHLNYTVKDDKGNERTIYFSNNEFNFYDMKDKSNKYIDFELNPYLETFNAANYVISQEYMNSSVGTHLNHPSKKFSKGRPINDLEEESERWLAQVKRNVSLSATKHSFALGLLNGIRSNYRIAVIRDDKAPTYNVFGQFNEDGAKPFDGSTLVCGTNNYLENNSLAGARAGDVKKQFVHSYKEETGSGIIIKTAGFPITNALIANSDFYRRMNKKMMKGIWTMSDGKTPFIPDITKNYFGDDIVYEPIFFKRKEADGTWTKWEVKRIEAIRDAKGNLTGGYKRYIKCVNNDGTDFPKSPEAVEYFVGDGERIKVIVKENNIDKEIEVTKINNNYALWQLFGGENALEIDPETNTLKDSESSFINVVQAMNSISEGKIARDKDGKILRNEDGSIKYELFDKKHPPLSQSQVHQNLKFSNIDYVVTEGAIKQGAANINDTKAYFEDNYELATMEVSMHDSGIQLDAEHHADESTLSIMTQVVNALCARGYTLTDASEAYQAMCALTEHGIVDYMEGLEDMFTTNDGTSLRNAVAKTVVKGLARLSDREGSLVEAVAETIIAEANSGKKITYKELKDKVPFSHPAIFNSLVSMISSALTKQGIKIKFPGSLAVLNPSNRIWQFHGDHWTKRDLVGDKEMDLKKLQAKYDKQFLNTAQIIPGHYYKVLDTSGKAVDMRQLNLGKSSNGKPKTGVDYVFVETPKELWKFKDWLAKNPGYNLVENVTEARDLAAYNATFEGEVYEIDPVTGANKTIRKAYSIWDLDIIKALYKIEDDIPSILKKVPKTKEYDTVEDWQNAMKSYIIKNTPDLIQYFISKDLVLNEDGTFSIDQHWDYDTFRDFENIVVHQFIESNPVLTQLNFENATYKELRKLARRELQRTLGAISTGKAKTAIIDGQTVTIDKSKLHIDPYELIMPKIYATKFGLRAGDSLADIMERGSDFFLERTLKNWATKTSEDNFDIELKHSNGKHVYIIQRELTETITDEEDPKYGQTFITQLGRKRGHEFDESSNKPTALEKDKNLFFRSEGNQTFRTDGAGNKIHNVYDMNDEIYVDKNGNEIIVTNNAQFYINEGHFDSIRFSDSVLNRGALETETRARTYMDILQDMKDNVKVQEYIDLLGNNKEWYANALDMNTYHRAEKLKDYNAEKLKQLRGKVEMPKAFKFIIDNSIEKFESFKQSLNILAARIPAQSMQSFMPMKVVGFDDSGVNNAYVNYFQFWLQGSDLDIDKVSLLGYAFTNNGTFVKWSPYFRMGTENSMNASKELPFPTGKKVYTKESSDPVELKAWKIIEKHPDLFFKPEGSNEWFLTKKLNANQLIALGQLIRAVNKQGNDKQEILYFPEGQEELAKAVANAVQGHNLYLDRSHDAQKAIMNFITNKMLKVSTNPINLIQSMSSVDDLTEYIKDIANTAESAKRANFFAPGNVEDKMETLILTLTGKENTGIVASAMKTYEALSFYYNNRLATSLEDLETLAGMDEDFLEIYYQDVNAIRDKVNYLKSLRTASKDEVKQKIHRLLIPSKVICGQSVSMLSNTYTDRTVQLLNAIDEEELYNAIQAVDNDSDAFLLVSALLSLSTDFRTFKNF